MYMQDLGAQVVYKKPWNKKGNKERKKNQSLKKPCPIFQSLNKI